MGLVDYSDSDASDTEATPAIKTPAVSSKPAFQKVVDRSNPGKIRVTLPGTAVKSENNGDEPPAKRVKSSGGGLGGLNAFLPAPKRTGVTANTTLGGGRIGIGAGMGLKTGAAPGFSRGAPDAQTYNTEEEPSEAPREKLRGGMGLPAPKAATETVFTPAAEVKLVGKPLMFKPLSVARKPTKKKTTASNTSTQPSDPAPNPVAPAPLRPRVSLFSVAADPTESYTTPSTGAYQPMVYGARSDEGDGEGVDEDNLANHQTYEASEQTSISQNQSLDSIASDLNLSAADRRQLFGRQKGRNGGAPTASKVINFNTDQEYRHNEELRASGETIMHNPVRAIAPGKHNLKQLVNAAASQKEALEESFAKGKSNRAEASSRYGW